MIDRIVSFLVCLAATVVPIHAVAFFQMREIQLIAAILVVALTVLYDAIVGLFLGLTLIILYYRLHWRYITIRGSWDDQSVRMGGPMVSLVRQYITPEHLKDAQTNVVDERDNSVEIVGVQGVYGEDVYGAQGMYMPMPALTKEIGSPVA